MCCWSPALLSWRHHTGVQGCQHSGCGTPCPCCQLAAWPLEIQSLPEVPKTQTQTWQNSAARDIFTLVDAININPNKPSYTLPRRERCLHDTHVDVQAGSLSTVVIATGAAADLQQLCNSGLHLQKCNSIHEAFEQQQRPKPHGLWAKGAAPTQGMSPLLQQACPGCSQNSPATFAPSSMGIDP